MNLGPAAKSAIRNITDVLAHLKAEHEAGIPTALRGQVKEIRQNTKASGTRDAQLESAEAWAVSVLEKALGEDNAVASAEIPVAPPAPEPAEAIPAPPGPESGNPIEVSVVHGGVTTEPQPENAS